ncbi:MAG: dTMP kinase [Alphaproteobacteria bacterium]|nr:dTMP kinase [Alphaproteobacteria bacterium]MBM3732237.1 dTMP kinase [Acidimicrobiia bacterium]
MTPGKLITFEGGEGAGKSTQIARLAERLRARGIDPVTTREPGGSPGAEAIRALLVQGDPGRWTPMTEALLHYAARLDHLERTIRPALGQGRWVISDRFADSTVAYQGYGHRLGREAIASLHRLLLGDFAPDLTVIFDIPVEVGLGRAAARAGESSCEGTPDGVTRASKDAPLSGRYGDSHENRYERMDGGFHERMRQGFLEIARAEPARCVVVDANRDADSVAADVWRAVETRLLGKG